MSKESLIVKSDFFLSEERILERDFNKVTNRTINDIRKNRYVRPRKKPALCPMSVYGIKSILKMRLEFKVIKCQDKK